MSYLRHPNSLQDMLKVIYQQTGIEKSVSEFGAVKVWPMVVGEHIAKVSEVEKILYGVLHIKVKNAAWRNELTFKKKDIIAQLNIRIGKDLVQDIIFK